MLNDKGVYEIPIGNPTLFSRDGLRKARLSVVISPSWLEEERREFGVYTPISTDIPNGYVAIHTMWELWEDGLVHEVHTIRPSISDDVVVGRIGGRDDRTKRRIIVTRTGGIKRPLDT
jgi:hypothetical protein